MLKYMLCCLPVNSFGKAMGDETQKQLLEEEQYRLSTFGKDNFVGFAENSQFAKAGFFLTPEKGIAKCYACGLQLKACDLKPDWGNVASIHRRRSPTCPFIQKYLSKIRQTKCFSSVQANLRDEQARLNTFVGWPVKFLSPADLAADGFYFLRDDDHCACYFCKGIIGKWEATDTPRGEHQKHFSQCPFINGKAVGNIPIAQSLVLSKFKGLAIDNICKPLECNVSSSEDVTGHGPPANNAISQNGLTQKMKGVNLSDIGLHEYRGPKHKDYITVDSRINSFKFWPSGVKLQPREIAEAGFFYCGTSDHVRCFHCGNGVCNWENDDDPWEVHAICNPKCSYVLLTKGQDFVCKLPKGESVESCDTPPNVSESDLDCLMKLDVMCSLKTMGLPEQRLRAALRTRIEKSGLPFINVEQCMDSLFMSMEEDARRFIEESSLEDEDGEERSSSLNSNSSSASTSTSSSSAMPPSPSEDIAGTLPQLPRPADPQHSLPPLPQLRMHMPIAPLPQVTNGLQLSLPPVNGTTEHNGRQISVHENLSQERPSQSARSIHLPVQMDSSQVKIKPQLVSEPPAKQNCTEKSEVTSGDKIKEELDRARETLMCKVCLNAEMTIVFLPCSHMATCANCALSLSKCPVCRGEIKYTIKPILS